jgi:hypothetical protein
MAHLFSEKTVITRKKHRCNACERVFPEGTQMNVQRIADEGTIYSWYSCRTCQALMSKFSDQFDDGYGGFESGCISNALNHDQTPEQMLEELEHQREVENVARWQQRFNEPLTKYPIT